MKKKSEEFVTNTGKPKHFAGKEATQHVIEAQANGRVDAAENHAVEMSGPLFAATDAARETGILLPLLTLFLSASGALPIVTLTFLALFTLAYTFWKAARSAWLGWSRLERLHRVVAEEKWEIEHHRAQERWELKELYRAKGFEGKLLEDVLDVLMADGDRLLRVMVEEELGLRLEEQEHPLKQSLCAGTGVLLSSLLLLPAFAFFGWGLQLAAALILIAGAGALSAYKEKNKMINAIVWHLGFSVVTFGLAYFMMQVLFQ